jgi:hypothetical protein
MPVIVLTVHHAAHTIHDQMHPPGHTGQPTHPAAHADTGPGGHVWLLLLVAAFIFALAYRASITRHPYRNCPHCDGSGKHRGVLFTRAFRACDHCDGTGRQLRAGAKEPD